MHISNPYPHPHEIPTEKLHTVTERYSQFLTKILPWRRRSWAVPTSPEHDVRYHDDHDDMMMFGGKIQLSCHSPLTSLHAMAN